MLRARLSPALALLLLSACVELIPKTTGPGPVRPVPRPTASPTPAPTPSPGPTQAIAAGVRAGPDVATLGIDQPAAQRALASFKESCPRLVARTDGSGLTQGADWQLACDAATSWPTVSATGFFARYFETARVGEGTAFATGYYEPEIAGVRAQQLGFAVPVYRLPPDLIRAKPGEAPPLENGQQPLGRYDATGIFVPYHDRAAIEDGALSGKDLEIAWVADEVEFFFLQVQGSGMLRAPDGRVMRIGYAGQNGLPYTGIGGVMRQRGMIGTEPGQISGSMQGIMGWLRANPVEGKALMRENKSWVFFRELTGGAPLGALGIPVRARASVAADPRFVPLGAPVWLDLDRNEADGLWIAQDTGGAIKGANRFDTFWGAGSEARTTAGGMSGRGSALILLPRGSLQRLGIR